VAAADLYHRLRGARTVALVPSWWETAMTRRRTSGDPGIQKLRRIEAVTDAALSGLQLEELLAELLERTRELLAVDTATILLVDDAGKDLVVTAASGLEEEVRQAIRVPIGEGFAGRIAAEGHPIALDHPDDGAVVSQAVLDKRLTSMVGVPMLSPDRVIGVLHVGSVAPRAFTPDDVDLLRLVADRASLATQARLSQLDRSAALALQRSLLPARPPTVDGLEVAARYVPGAQVGVGGDWYDLFQLPSGHVGVVIGDVAGSGLRAAVVMGRIRSALRAYALETTDPADVLTRLDHKIQMFEPDAMATAFYAVIDPAREAMTMSSAGHLPPVIVTGSGPAQRLCVPADLPLGGHPRATRRVTFHELRPGATLLLYTDGLIERRGQPIEEGMRALEESATTGTPEALCARITARLLADGAPTDDVAILAVRRTTA
jgi:putative methionine-R-sulfoxide reductase with GAF domain